MTVKEHPYAAFVHLVDKPARYLGGEYNQVVKDWSTVDSRFCLAFPDVYDIGMSHMGTKILYGIVNKAPDLLMERCFAPWVDMEREIRSRDLPLVSLETARPLRDFDVVGFSLQFELTYTNVLTMLDLGGIPLRNADRTLEDPLIIAGGPSATHAEPMAPFIDAFVVGDAEERLPRLLRHWAQMKADGRLSRLEMLAVLAREGGVYAPDLYVRERCERTGMLYVSGSPFEGVPLRVQRAFVDDINRFPFPDNAPVAVAEAIFDRMSIEIARGCTEGCRFCQAGMIYRPVRERDPDQIVDTVLSAVEKGGYDAVSITALSTADYSCISPLVKKLTDKLSEKKVSLGVSSLRAYGLAEETLDDIASFKATGLTFAPEAGSQRMRDVINKNVTEKDIFESCHRVFSRGWRRIKLYFILGLPTETDEDVLAIAQMARQAREIGRQYVRSGVQVTVSVSMHVPKPHTPFQWVAMADPDDVRRKQEMLRDLARRHGFDFRRHDLRQGWIECIVGRGDISIGDVIEDAWRAGTRFDSWDESLNFDAWRDAVAAWEQKHGRDRAFWFATMPTDGRTPWDHIDVGLADGFLRREYQRAVAGRLSPPCGKPVGAKVHHTNLDDARADNRKLVCYNCGVACDMTQMRTERIDALAQLGAEHRVLPREGRPDSVERFAKGMKPREFGQGRAARYRMRFEKLGPMALEGHIDLVRSVPRIFRRAGIQMFYTEGFTPRPLISFGPALGLGARSIAEYADIGILADLDAHELMALANQFAPAGFRVTGMRRLADREKPLSNLVDGVETIVTFTSSAIATLVGDGGTPEAAIDELRKRIDELAENRALMVEVRRKDKGAPRPFWDVALDIAPFVTDDLGDLAIGDGRVALRIQQHLGRGASMKPQEIAAVVAPELTPRDIVRTGCWAIRDGSFVDPLDIVELGGKSGLEPRDDVDGAELVAESPAE